MPKLVAKVAKEGNVMVLKHESWFPSDYLPREGSILTNLTGIKYNLHSSFFLSRFPAPSSMNQPLRLRSRRSHSGLWISNVTIASLRQDLPLWFGIDITALPGQAGKCVLLSLLIASMASANKKERSLLPHRSCHYIHKNHQLIFRHITRLPTTVLFQEFDQRGWCQARGLILQCQFCSKSQLPSFRVLAVLLLVPLSLL